MTKLRTLLGGIIGFLVLLYPLAVYLGIQYLQPWSIAALLMFLVVFRLLIIQADKSRSRILLITATVYCALAVWNNNLITLLFYPVLMNFALLLVFAGSLFYPPTIIERFARLQHPDLPEKGILYTRKVTQVWCVFFLFNGLIATYTAIWSSFAWWSLYNGIIAYVLMGLLMAIEYGVRIRSQEHVR